MDTNKFGFHIVVTSLKEMSAAELLERCHGRAPEEKLWRTMKSDLEAKSLK